jgi:histone acetyltransferase
VLDTEILFSLFFKEQDANAKQIYYFLFKLLRKSILNLKEHSSTTTTATAQTTQNANGSFSSSPNSNVNSIPAAIEAHLGRPPFDEPSITKAVVNFLFVKVNI